MSGATESMVLDHLPEDGWLADLGSHPLRDLPRPERVVQLCHPDIRNDFPPLRTSETETAQRLPVQLTSFVGRQAQIHELRGLLADNRLVTLTGAGGSGKTRLAVQIAHEFGDSVRYADLAPITDPDLAAVAVARALGLPDQPGRTTMQTIVRFVGDTQMLLVLDNCEHLLDASAEIILAARGMPRPHTADDEPGAELPTFLSYITEKRLSKHKAEFGKGAIEGVAGPEAANNASAAGTLVPMLSLGLPTNATAAVMLTAFVSYGIQPGPTLFEKEPLLI